MQSPLLRGVFIALIVGAFVLTLNGCGKGDGLSGTTYHAASGGPVTIDFKDGKAKVDIGGEVKTLDYKVDGDTVTIVNKEEGDLVLNRHPDGSLTCPLGTLNPAK